MLTVWDVVCYQKMMWGFETPCTLPCGNTVHSYHTTLYRYMLYCLAWFLLQFRSLASTSECLFALINGDDMYATFSIMSFKSPMLWWYSRVYLYCFISLYIYVVISLFISVIMDAYDTIKVKLWFCSRKTFFCMSAVNRSLMWKGRVSLNQIIKQNKRRGVWIFTRENTLNLYCKFLCPEVLEISWISW
jgi:hypothetical protein